MSYSNLGGARATIRAPVNPLDKSTVVSIYPIGIDERKHTIQPGRFIIPPGSFEKPSTLVVGSSSWWKEMDEEQPMLEIPQSSLIVADSIVKDYCNGLFACNMSNRMPGLFYVMGEKTVDMIRKDHLKELTHAKENQRNWFMELVKAADVLWARTNGNPISISDTMKIAAEQLQIKDKPWLKDFATIQLTNCPACGFLRNSNFPMCQNCRTIIDKKKYEDMGLAVAK